MSDGQTEGIHASRRHPWGTEGLPEPHVWTTLGYRNAGWEPGRAVIEWDAPKEFCFLFNDGYRVHGGMLATLLDTAMGGACWTLMDEDEHFLTGDLNVEFYRSARPGLLRAEGRVVHRTKRLVFCAAEIADGDGNAIAGSRCTQVVLAERS
jgi:uncharacterized protein (TIGR00369 family)